MGFVKISMPVWVPVPILAAFHLALHDPIPEERSMEGILRAISNRAAGSFHKTTAPPGQRMAGAGQRARLTPANARTRRCSRRGSLLTIRLLWTCQRACKSGSPAELVKTARCPLCDPSVLPFSVLKMRFAAPRTPTWSSVTGRFTSASKSGPTTPCSSPPD